MNDLADRETGFDRLMPSAEICSINGNIHAVTLRRRIKAGLYPPPDRVINKRNYWFESTARRALAGQEPVRARVAG